MTLRVALSLVPLLAGCTPSLQRAGPTPVEGRVPGSLAANVVVEGTAGPARDSAAAGMFAMDVLATARSPRAIGDLRGRRVTILVPDADPPRLGERFTLFGAVLTVDSGVTLRQLLRVNRTIEELRDQIALAEQAQLDSILRDHMSRAERVVVGTVESVADSSGADPRDSEHNPLWHVAHVRVRETLKGPPELTAAVWFPTSRDMMWLRSPRFTASESGIWILRRLEPPGRLTALDSVDFQPAGARARLRQLLTNR